MPRPAASLLLLGAAALGLWFYSPVLLSDRQFAYRDAAHYYYPLYQRVEQEWNAGRLPLWSPEENAGMPLLGNPTAAVLYPLKLIYRLAPSYAWGARLYVVAHSALALVAMYILARGWGISPIGSALAACSFAFAAPILFQYCNVIYLVGAAWLPLGFHAADAWIRLGKRRALAALAAVLAMQTLGGDPQAAYLTGLFAALYAVLLSRPSWPRLRFSGLALILLLWFGTAIAAAALLARDPSKLQRPPEPLPWTGPATWSIRAAWLLSALILIAAIVRMPEARRFGSRLGGLLLAAILAALISGAQLFPVLEFTAQTARSAESGPHDIYPFSVEPTRLLELVWPGVFGSFLGGNSSWLALIPPHRPDIWVPSLYGGALVLILALASRGPATPIWQRWLGLVTLISLLASFGRFGSPIWLARLIPALQPWIGTHDPPDVAAIRFDGQLRDGDGGVYWALATFLPGFSRFRYPAKLLTFACLGLSVLAGAGLDRIRLHQFRSARHFALGLALVSATLAAGLFAQRDAVIAAFRNSPLAGSTSLYGPFSPAAAWHATIRATTHGALVAVALLALLRIAHLRPRWGAGLILAFQAFDLALANRDLIITVPTPVLETPPALLERIQAAERESPTPGGFFRVHRTPHWEPRGWGLSSGADRYRQLVEWERDTLQPKYGVPLGLHYTLTQGVAELYDYEYFFAPFEAISPDRSLAARFLGRDDGKPLVAFPRRGFDLWNTRYFILPYVPGNDESRGYASFLPDAEILAPRFPDQPDRDDQRRQWALSQDWQLLRNRASYPRAWIVHDAIVRPPIRGLRRLDREPLMRDILYQADPLWTSPDRPIYDPRRIAWVETDEVGQVAPFLARTPVHPSETPRIVRYEPQLVVIDVTLQTPGLLVFADVYYPGWRLELDGQPAPLLRVNRMMRGAGVPSGSHRLTFRYDPDSLRWGLAATVLGFCGLALVLRPGRRQPTTCPSGVDRC
ncbi:MAG: hypothetical protein KatS3mg108_1839 [Isosphaeraceae bacterium]|jgi:hypothetical protein|nr:MAG: hypothetical protein KatS3mg108_1839 [Isosphaeraceae bacterium]